MTLTPQIICDRKMSRTYSLSTEAFTGTEKATFSIQCYQANYSI